MLEPEALGSKEKFWYRAKVGEPEWLFKFPQVHTGQHWAEKVAAEVARALEILHARVELADFQGTIGSATESFARDGRNLFHGNQILAGKVLDYDAEKEFRQSNHTLANIFTAIDRTFTTPEGAHKAKLNFANYLLLDSVISNTDRHHENWGILRKRMENRWQGMLAPTFDHASSLGRELVDVSDGKCRERLLREKRGGNYSEKGHGAIYWERTDKRALSPLELVRRAAVFYPDLFRPALARLEHLDRTKLTSIIRRIPLSVSLRWQGISPLN